MALFKLYRLADMAVHSYRPTGEFSQLPHRFKRMGIDVFYPRAQRELYYQQRE